MNGMTDVERELLLRLADTTTYLIHQANITRGSTPMSEVNDERIRELSAQMAIEKKKRDEEQTDSPSKV